MIEDTLHLITTDAGKPFQKLVNGCTVAQILEERSDRDTSSLEDPRSTHDVWVPFDCVALCPVFHGFTCLLSDINAYVDRNRLEISLTTSSIGNRTCSSESRSRRVTVLSSSTVWPSMVTHQGVPISSWRR